MSRLITLVLATGLLLGASQLVAGQRLFGVEGASALTWDFPAASGGTCPAPTPGALPCSHAVAICPGVPALEIVPGVRLHSDIADDPLTDIVYVTDGFVIGAFTGDRSCGLPPCSPLSAFEKPAGIFGLTGMGCDSSESIEDLRPVHSFIGLAYPRWR